MKQKTAEEEAVPKQAYGTQFVILRHSREQQAIMEAVSLLALQQQARIYLLVATERGDCVILE